MCGEVPVWEIHGRWGHRLTSLEVHVGTPIQKCEEINARLLESKEEDGGYAKDLFDNLVYRNEEPNGMTRWDSPLFTVPFDDEKPPLEDIWEAMIGSEGKAKVVKPNQATTMVGMIPLIGHEIEGFTLDCRNRPPNPIISTNSIRPHKRYSMLF